MREADFPKHFLNALQAEECILFVGSGISIWSGLPTWAGLIGRMVDFLEAHGASEEDCAEIIRMKDRGDLLSAASMGKLLMSSAEFTDFVDEVFISSNPQPHEIHELIVSLPPDSYITTNYDKLLDNAYQKVHGGLVLRAVNNNQPPEQARIQKHGSSRFVFTPHGRAESVDTMVVTNEDYRELTNHSQATIEATRNLLVSRPVLLRP